jgi:hypothetical protein
MKPFPEAVQKAFPCAPGRVPDRPWWWYGAKPYRRRLIPAFDTGANEQYLAKTDEEAVEADAKYPIPHPGFRAGQIWAAEDGDSVSISQIRNYTDNFGIWTGDAYWTRQDFEGVYPYLIADPACPHLAPWSPVEEKPC